MRTFRFHAHARRLTCATIFFATACMVLVAACGPGSPVSSQVCLGPTPPDQAFDNCGGAGGGTTGFGGMTGYGGTAGAGGANGGCPCGRPMASKQNPVITTVGQCTPGSFGTMKWDVTYSLPTPATTCGWVIQMIAHTTPDGTKDQYWEAFYIAQNATTTGNLYPTADDEFGTPFGAPLEGDRDVSRNCEVL